MGVLVRKGRRTYTAWPLGNSLEELAKKSQTQVKDELAAVGNADHALGFDDQFRRMWRYYLAYCEGGFRSGRVDVRQIVMAR